MLALSSASSTLLCGAFYPHAQITRRHQAAVVYSAVSNKTIDPESNFWFSVTRTDAAEDQKKSEPALSSKWPVVPSLDIDGPLPPNCYNSFGQEEFQPKPTCALAIAVNLRGPRTKDTFDSDLAVGGMQQFIDHGLTTFHLGGLPSTQVSSVSMDGGDCLWLPSSCQIWGETQVYSMLQKSTPRSVMNSCNLVVPMTLPPVEADRSVVNRVSARKTITDSLRRIGTDSIDTIEVQHCHESPYHFDIMNYLVDLQRDGLVKSIAGRNFPEKTMRALEGCGYHFDSHHLNFNILSSGANLPEYQLTASDLGTPNVFSNPLAGGLLTDMFEGHVFPPLSEKDGAVQSRLFTETLQRWAGTQQQKEGQGNETVPYLIAWQQYQNKLLPRLRDIAQQYRVSIASLALRWVLQTEQTGGTVVGFDLAENADNDSSSCSPRQVRSLRDVFRFELDDEDLESILAVSGMKKGNLNDSQEGHEKLDLAKAMTNPKLLL